MELKLKQMIVMRNDLNMRKGKMIAQGAHAAMAFLLDDPKLLNGNRVQQWLDTGQTKICVRTETLEEFNDLYSKCATAGFITHLITDSGRTEFGGVATPTCFAVGPDRCDSIDKILGHLKLL